MQNKISEKVKSITKFKKPIFTLFLAPISSISFLSQTIFFTIAFDILNKLDGQCNTHNNFQPHSSPSASAVLLVSMSSSTFSSMSSTVSAHMRSAFPALASVLNVYAASNYLAKSFAASTFWNLAASFVTSPSALSEQSPQDHM